MDGLLTRDSVRNLLDAAVPVAVFLVCYQVFGVAIAVTATVAAAGVIAVWRLLRGDPLKAVGIAFAAVLLYSSLVVITGEGRNFFLPEIVVCTVLAVVFGATVMVRRPVSRWVCRRLRLEPETIDPAQFRRHQVLTAIWAVNWALHVVIFVPMYIADQVAALGVATMVLGKPSVVVALAASWWWIRKGSRRPDAERRSDLPAVDADTRVDVPHSDAA